MKNTFLKLLKEWCDALVQYQITHLDDKGIFGGIICPACSFIHGRCYVAVHPLLYMARLSGDKKYITAAENLILWSEHMHCPDGSFVNDSMAEWKGISAFSAVALTKALYEYGDLLKPSIKERLEELVSSCLEYLYYRFDIFTRAPINYLGGTAYALELGGKYKGNSAYRAKAKEYIMSMMEYITDNGLLYGEVGGGVKSWEISSPKGCRIIDIGYNVEESLNFMVLYASSSGDENILNCAIKMASALADFFIPDGGWDNSFGSRMDKWTYWGSRTTDGCQPAYTILSEYDDRFAFIAWKNAEYLFKCTYDGLLYGGRDLHSYGEPACIHHTFTHAVGIVTALEWMDKKGTPKITLNDAVFDKYYEELDIYLYSSKSWRATITGYDVLEKPNCQPSGGALSLLYHKGAGIILSSSMTVYRRFESVNTQRNRQGEDNPLTLRMQMIKDGVPYSNILDRNAVIEHLDNNVYLVKGNIVDSEGNMPVNHDSSFQIKYIFEEKSVRIIFINKLGADIYIPVVVSKEDHIDGFTIYKDRYSVNLSSNAEISGGRRIFNLVPGFQAAEFKIENTNYETEITIHVES